MLVHEIVLTNLNTISSSSMNRKHEWSFDAPWGKIACVSWGDISKPPVLMVHGYMDSAATFYPLVELLTDEYFYVAFDLPGHGKSAPFPPGSHVTQVHFIEAVRRVVDHMGWKTFVYLAHSMSVIIGWLYNAIYPGTITRMIGMDPGKALAVYSLLYEDPKKWFLRYDKYYSRYFGKSAADDRKLYKYDKIVNLVSKHRQLTREEAEIVLFRCLLPVGEGLYRLSWEPRIRSITSLSLSKETLFHISVKQMPTIIILSTDDSGMNEKAVQFTTELLNECTKLNNNCSIVTVTGHHNVHITRADKMADLINEFLKKECCNITSKI